MDALPDPLPIVRRTPAPRKAVLLAALALALGLGLQLRSPRRWIGEPQPALLTPSGLVLFAALRFRARRFEYPW